MPTPKTPDFSGVLSISEAQKIHGFTVDAKPRFSGFHCTRTLTMSLFQRKSQVNFERNYTCFFHIQPRPFWIDDHKMTGAFPVSKQAQRERAQKTDLVLLLRSQGESLKPSGAEWEWISQGQKVTIRENLWYHQYEQVGGDAISFVRKFMGMNYVDAVAYLLRYHGEPVPEQCCKEAKPFVLPAANANMNRVFAYLVNRRGIGRDVVYSFVHRKMIYESAKHHNVVFVGFDTDGVPRHAHKRSTAKEGTYKCNASGSLPEYSFHWVGSGGLLYLFEAPIDLLSFITINQENWQRQNYAAACSVSDKVLFQMLHDYPEIQMVYLCFDNDEAGQNAAKRISDKLFIHGVKSQVLLPSKKDWNEDLLCSKGGA